MGSDIISHVTVPSIEHKWVLEQVLSLRPSVVCVSVTLCVCLCIVETWLILVGLLGPRMRHLVEVGDCPTGRAFWGVDSGHFIVTNGGFVT